jgi:hypothetical protein
MSGADSDTVQRNATPSLDGLLQPAFLHHRGIFGMANEGEVRVQDQREITVGHREALLFVG